MPLVPTTDSRMIAAILLPPSNVIVSRRCCNARSHSCAGESAWNADRYAYGPQNFTRPGIDGSLSRRRPSPVSPIAAAVPPW